MDKFTEIKFKNNKKYLNLIFLEEIEDALSKSTIINIF